MTRYLLLFALLPFLANGLQAQNLSWRKHYKLAEDLYRKAQYAEAAQHYQAAWEQKQKKKDLIYKAGECYFIIKDYEHAATAYEQVKEKYKLDPLTGLKYARALKQAGRYEDASREFSAFLESYKGNDRDQIAHLVQDEIRGCELGLQLLASADQVEIELEHLNNNINSPETEFAPIPFNDEILYYSSTMGGRAQIYRSQKVRGEWSKATTPASFPAIDDDHFCNGTLTPDSKRFYFTICKSIESWGGLTTRCELYVTRRIGSGWSAPERLKDYVNVENATTTHPYVVYNGDTEILYFASNRQGGFGGMDIWYMTRDINSNDIDFTFPVNAGPTVNTQQDEITPYYDLDDATLYFASNGLITMGGYDIFKASGSRSQWQEAENIGLPFNSSADDFFFILTPSRANGYLVSNRIFEPTKTTTTHEDIFAFSLPENQRTKETFAIGTIFDQNSENPLPMANVNLYRVEEDGRRELIISKISDDGAYNLQLSPNALFEVEVTKPGYFSQVVTINTQEMRESNNYGLPIYLEPRTLPDAGNPGPPVGDPGKTDPAGSNETDDPYTLRGQSSHDNLQVVTTAPRSEGTYYKIQIIAIRTFEEDHPRYAGVRNIGRFDTERIVEKNLTRVLIADFGTIEEAKVALNLVEEGGFPDAFIVRYQDGQRMERYRGK